MNATHVGGHCLGLPWLGAIQNSSKLRGLCCRSCFGPRMCDRGITNIQKTFRGSQSRFPLLTPTMQAGQDSDWWWVSLRECVRCVQGLGFSTGCRVMTMTDRCGVDEPCAEEHRQSDSCSTRGKWWCVDRTERVQLPQNCGSGMRGSPKCFRTLVVKIKKTNSESNSRRDFSKRINFTRVDPFVWDRVICLGQLLS